MFIIFLAIVTMILYWAFMSEDIQIDREEHKGAMSAEGRIKARLSAFKKQEQERLNNRKIAIKNYYRANPRATISDFEKWERTGYLEKFSTNPNRFRATVKKPVKTTKRHDSMVYKYNKKVYKKG